MALVFSLCARKLLLGGMLLFSLVVVQTGARSEQDGSQPVDFRQQIQPLLSRSCFACHGPDEATRQADLRLDIEADAKQRAIVAGDAEASLLVGRIFSTDADEVMPPPDALHPLTDDERKLLKQWIDEGAKWQSHWAFDPISVPEVDPDETRWGKNEIDFFVARQIQSQGMAPSPEAERTTLLRRLYLDLIGIPPTPEQRDRFLADNTAGAYEAAVDELFRSPQYGEQMAVAWLDAARFADTNGYQNDFNRSMWPWRDWVIKAFNDNMPYDQFVIEQIAGDLLPDPTPEQLVATGFNRNNRSVTEGGVIVEEWRIENCVDRVETTAATFLGLTMGCARCHDHKYDPISQKEFYEFFAFFNNIDEQGVYNETRGNVGPQLTVATPAQTAKLSHLKQQIAALENERSERLPSDWIAQWDSTAGDPQSTSKPKAVFSFTATETESPRGIGPASASVVLQGTADGIQMTTPPEFEFASDASVTWSVWVRGDARGAIYSKMNEDENYRGVDGLILGDGRIKIHLIDQWAENAIAVITKQPLQSNHWQCVTVTYDGSSKAAGLRVYLDGQPLEVDVERDSLTGVLNTEIPFKIGQRSKGEFLTGEVGEFRLYAVELTTAEVMSEIQTAVAQHHQALIRDEAPAETLAVTTTYVNRIGNDPVQVKINALQSEYDREYASLQTTMIMRDRADYRETYLLKRGQYDLPETTEALWPSIPATLPPLTEQQPRNRLGLAKWMVDDRNPLVARVAVNRAWIKFFGRGLVESADNFGVQGSPPTHPLLLDWLANDFRASGWDLNRLQKQIVMSATYRQASDLTEALLELDPTNRYHARGPRYRMNAEQVRDAALARGGLLVQRQGGPSVFPYQPEGLWDELAGGANGGPYVQSQGDDLYRRSLYTFRKRTVSHPVLATFDSPSWEICLLKRSRTNTPLQALALLNDVTYVEAARNLAQRMMLAAPEANASIRFGFDVVTLRQPTASELETLMQGFDNYWNFYQSDPQQAEQLVQVGESTADAKLDTTRLAAMTNVAAILLNLDEAITKE